MAAASEAPAEVEIALEPAPPLDVHVTDTQGNPISGTEIHICASDESAGVLVYGLERFSPNAAPLGKTGDDGVFRSDCLLLDDGFVYVRHPAYAPTSTPLLLGQPLQIQLQQCGTVQGFVEIEGETRPTEVHLGVSYPDKPELGTTWAIQDGDGRYRCDHVRPGPAVVCAKANWLVTDSHFYAHEITQGINVELAGLTDVVLHLAGGNCTLTGGVTVDGMPFGEFVIDVTVATSDGKEIRQTTHTDADGKFSIENMPAGEGQVTLRAWRNDSDVPAALLGPKSVSILPGQVNNVEFAFTASDLQ